MTANDTPENVASVPAEKSVTVDIDRTMLDAAAGQTYDGPKMSNDYWEYLNNHIPEVGTVEYQYMYIFGDQPWSMDGLARIAEQQHITGKSRIGSSDLVTHADISIPMAEESVSGFEKAVRKIIDSHSLDAVPFAGDVIASGNDVSDKTDDEAEGNKH